MAKWKKCVTARQKPQYFHFKNARQNPSKTPDKTFQKRPTNFPVDGIQSELTIEQLIFAACRGGWPAALDTSSKKAALLVADDYLTVVCDEDISRFDGVRRNATLARLILRSYARNLCTLAKKTVMLKDVTEQMESTSMSTFDDYVDVLERLFVLEDIEAWNPSIRSKTVIRSGKKRCFVDPSIAVAALGTSPERLELDLNTFGFVFECLCIRDLRVYSQSLGGRMSYYHDRLGLEADAVLHLSDGRYALIECKLGSREIEEAATHLKKLKSLTEEAGIEQPTLLMVLTGGQMAYRRDDGVLVVPIGCLRD